MSFLSQDFHKFRDSVAHLKIQAKKKLALYDRENAQKWGRRTVSSWLKSINLSECINIFWNQGIDGKSLLLMKEEDLEYILQKRFGYGARAKITIHSSLIPNKSELN